MAPTDREQKEPGVKRKLNVTEKTNENPRKREKNNEFLRPRPDFRPSHNSPSKGQDHSSPSASQLTPSSIGSKAPNDGSAVSWQGNDSKSNGNVMIRVDLDIKNGEYHLKLSNDRTSTEIDSAEKLAHSEAMLLFQGEMLRKLGEQLLSEFQESLQSIVKN